MIRLQPPEQEFKVDWFLELLGAPDVNAERTKTYYRVATANGDFAICSFNYLALAEWNPLETKYGIRIARPSMMALANMLHHPEIAPELIAETTNKRSNKDLGRVLALAWLAARKDQEEDTDVLGTWHQEMAEALKFYFPDRAKELATRAGAGISALMSSESDLNEALSICNRGLLASLEVNPNAFLAIGRKFTQMVIDPLAGKTALWS